MPHRYFPFFSFALVACILTFTGPACAQGVAFDAVAASVNGKPITISEVGKQFHPRRRLSLKEAALDPEARQALDALIFQKLIEEEAAAKKLTATDAEIDEYVKAVAGRNSLTPEALVQALKAQGRNIDEYRAQIRVEILKSKIAGQFIRAGMGVTDKEIDQYLSEHPSLTKDGTKVRLRQIVISGQRHSPEEARALAAKVHEQLQQGEAFAEAAKKYSEAAEAAEGGALGLFQENDLSADITAAIQKLSPGEISEIVDLGGSFHIFKVDERLAPENQQQKVRDEVRAMLQQKKLETKMTEYLSSELYKLYAVDKKI